MTTTTGAGAAPTEWYVLGETPSEGWPVPKRSPDAGTAWVGAFGGSPALVGVDQLVGPAELLGADAVAELSALLAPASLTLEAVTRGEATLHVTGMPAVAALDRLRAAAADHPSLAPAVAALGLVRLFHLGAPLGGSFTAGGQFDPPVERLLSVKSPFAGTTREAVVLIGAQPPVRGVQPPARRPVVAIVDAGIGGHPWLDGTPGDPVWQDAAELGWRPPVGPALAAADDVEAALDGDELKAFAGHGTFVAGLVHQLAPEARILSAHVMDASGVSRPENVVDALQWLAGRVQRGDPAEFVDVVCLAFGYYEAHPEQDAHTTALRAALGALGDAGVQVVVAAGNDDTDAPTFPAAFTALATAGLPAVPLVSVGATNPDGTLADYSNRGAWVLHREVGTSLVSTVPSTFDRTPAEDDAASVTPTQYDPDRTSGGLVRWGGTSFAAAVVAGRLALALTAQPDLTTVTPDAARARARAARREVLRA